MDWTCICHELVSALSEDAVLSAKGFNDDGDPGWPLSGLSCTATLRPTSVSIQISLLALLSSVAPHPIDTALWFFPVSFSSSFPSFFPPPPL